MGFFDAIMGNAYEMKIEDAIREYGALLTENEKIEQAYKVQNLRIFFTHIRLIIIDKGLAGSKQRYTSIPYKSITHFCVESSGSFSSNADLIIWILGADSSLKIPFSKDANIYKLQGILATYVSK